MDDAATTPSQIPSVQCSPRLSSRIAGSKRSPIREGYLPLSKVIKTSGFVASLKKFAKESRDLNDQKSWISLCAPTLQGSTRLYVSTRHYSRD